MPTLISGHPHAMYHLLVVDDHPVVRHGVARLLNSAHDLHVNGMAGTEQQALSILHERAFDAALVDITLGEKENGIALTREMARRSPQLPILVFSIHDEMIYAERALMAGARGYVMKRASDEELIDAVHRVLSGRIFLSERMQSRLGPQLGRASSLTRDMPVDRLSGREREVFELLGRGLSTRHIAQKLGISSKTVETHRARAKEKLNLESATELVRYAISCTPS